ncbi:MAG: InlB B-repeat-containing protein [Lachnospiraceae bacterium]|nr:InlB B-repeat-containing protein [Lachnospiraceae bacterium]
MKKRLMTVSILAAAVIGLAACGSGGGAQESSQSTGTEETQEISEESQETEAQTYVVTFYDSDGTTVLDTAEVEEGALLEEFTPEKEGYIFTGWFATPQMSHRFDFEAAVTQDTSVFAGFVSYVEDTRTFAILGSGKSPVLMESSWGSVIGDAQTMQKEENSGANIYTITLDLEAGDEFQFAMNSAWENQRGYGYLNTITQDGVEYFANSGGLGDTGVKRANIKVKVSGNYTLTLTTYPGEDTYDTGASGYSEDNKENFNINPYDTITWVYNGESQAGGVETQTDYYIKGAIITGWQDVYSDETKFTEENGIYTLTVELEEGDEFMFTSLITAEDIESVGNEYIRYTNIADDDAESLSYVTGTEGANLVAGAGGSYTFTYDPSTQILTVAFE